MDDSKRIERRVKLHDLRVLMSVVEMGSMNKAAERLATSQPAVSRAIADLERALGVRLLERTPGGIQPTQYGQVILKRGLAVFDELRQGVKDIRGRGGGESTLPIWSANPGRCRPVIQASERSPRPHFTRAAWSHLKRPSSLIRCTCVTSFWRPAASLPCCR